MALPEFESEVAFKKYIASGYDPTSIEVEDIYPVISEWAVTMTPWVTATWQEQDIRGKQWPFLFAKLVERLSKAHYDAKRKIQDIQQELIEAKREISKLKRNK